MSHALCAFKETNLLITSYKRKESSIRRYNDSKIEISFSENYSTRQSGGKIGITGIEGIFTLLSHRFLNSLLIVRKKYIAFWFPNRCKERFRVLDDASMQIDSELSVPV